jgi:hypothetical protein
MLVLCLDILSNGDRATTIAAANPFNLCHMLVSKQRGFKHKSNAAWAFNVHNQVTYGWLYAIGVGVTVIGLLGAGHLKTSNDG